jgi:hypothetical protein
MQADNDTVVPVTAPSQSESLNARRRLLRGTFAAPTVLTLSSGSALANTSALRCFNNMPSDFSGSTGGVPGNFFQVHRYSLTVGSSTTSTTKLLVNAADIQTIERNQGFATSALASGKTWIDLSTGLEFVPGSNEVPTKDGQVVALRFEMVTGGTKPSARVVGFANATSAATGPGKVLSASCWSSFGK